MCRASLTRVALLSGAALAGIAFVVLYVILGVTLWVSFVGTGAAAVIGMSSGMTGARLSDGRLASKGTSHNSIVNVVDLRVRFLLGAVLTVIGGFLAGQVFAFAPVTAAAIGLAIGIGMVALPFVLTPTFRQGMRRYAWGALATLTAVDGVWQIVQTQAFSQSTAKWLSFADGLALAGIGLVALILHELSTERVVHAIEVVETTPDRPRYVPANGRPEVPAA